MRNRLKILSIIIFLGLVIIVINWPWRWIILNGWAASSYADRMLLGYTIHDDRFIDYIVYNSSGCVVFSEHEKEEIRMVYCPSGLPSDLSNIGRLKHIVGVWYQADTMS